MDDIGGEEIIAQIAAKLECADYCGVVSTIHTSITLTFKPGETLTVEEERLLLLLIQKRLQSQRQYVCCNRSWQPGPKFQAFLHVHEFKDEQVFQDLLIKGLRVK